MALVFDAGKVGELGIEGDEDAFLLHGEAEEKGVGHLKVAKEAVAKGSGEGGPRAGDGPVVIAEQVGEVAEELGGLFEGMIAGAGGGAEKAGLGEGADAAVVFAGVFEPGDGGGVAWMVLVGEGHEDAGVEEIFGAIGHHLPGPGGRIRR